MRGMGAALALAGAASSVSAPPPAAAELPPHTLLVLVAPWCGPCWNEVRHLDAMAAAAAPLAVRVFVMEEGPQAHAMVAGLPNERRWSPAAERRGTVRAFLWARTPGLPFSVVTDARGAICAERGGTLDGAQVRVLTRSCGSGL